MNLRGLLSKTGPGLIIAATGLGAGDIVAATVAGAQFGTTLLWVVVIGAVLKFCLNEGLARWQLVTGKTLLEGWIDHLPRALSWYFFVYLLLWSFMVSAALMAATGLAAHAVLPGLSVASWGILHAIVATILVFYGGYHILETLMKVFIGMMFIAIMICAVLVLPEFSTVISGLFIPRLPDDSVVYVLGIIGGVGGSVTVMSYGYWMREAGWDSSKDIGVMRVDLAIAYGLTGLFALAIIVVSAGVQPDLVTGNNMALAVAERLGQVAGGPTKWIFLIGFWGAVFSSMIGVWHGVPYLFANFFNHFSDTTPMPEQRGEPVLNSLNITQSKAYRYYLLYLSVIPMSLLVLDRPVWIVVLYAVTGAFFMPLLAVTLLFMNSSRQWLGRHSNGFFSKLLLVLCLLLFSFLLFKQVQSQLL